MKLSKLFVLGLMAVAMAFVSCSGQDGEQGPKGDPGESIKGDPGTPGTPGADGSANAFTYDLVFESSPVGQSNFSLKVPQITQEVLEEDTILVYFAKGDAETVYPVPGTSLDGTVSIRVLMSLEALSFTVFDWNGNQIGLPPAQVDYVKLIIIENTGTEDAAAKNGSEAILAQLKAADVNVGNYQDVVNYFGIQ